MMRIDLFVTPQEIPLFYTKGRRVVIVSSGAIALGTKKLGYRARPKEMARLQATRTVGDAPGQNVKALATPA